MALVSVTACNNYKNIIINNNNNNSWVFFVSPVFLCFVLFFFADIATVAAVSVA